MKQGAIVLLYIFSFLSISACRQQNTLADLKHYVDILKQQPPMAIAKVPDFHLNAVVKAPQHVQHDPFAALKVQPHCKQQLHVLTDVKLVGTLIQGQHRLALLQTPEGIVSVTPGQTISSKSIKLITVMPKYIALQYTNKQHIRRNFILKLERP